MNKPLVFFVDDEVSKTERYREALQKYFRVTHFVKLPPIEELIQLIVAEGPVVLIQDVMMPVGGNGKIDILAGIEVAEGVKDTLLALSIPLVLFSNRIVSEYQEEVKNLEYPEHLIQVKFKPTCGYQPFAKDVYDLYLASRAEE